MIFAIVFAVIFAVCFIEGVMPLDDFVLLFGIAAANAFAVYYFRKRDILTALTSLKSILAR